MAQQYRLNWQETGDALAPDFFVDDASTFAGEINGGLDRDNFAPADIVSAELDASGSSRVFNATRGNNTATPWAAARGTTSWQNGDPSASTGGNNLGISTWTSTQDSQYDVHWSGEWSWNGSYSWVAAGTRPTQTDTFDTVQIRVTIDGLLVGCVAGPFEDGDQKWSTYIVGGIQLPAGTHTALVECRAVRIIAQNGQEDGICTNTCTFGERALTILERIR